MKDSDLFNADNIISHLKLTLPHYGVGIVSTAYGDRISSAFSGAVRPDPNLGLIRSLFHLLKLPEVSPEYRYFYLNRWMEQGHQATCILTLNDDILDELEDLLKLHAIGAQAHFSLRIILIGDLNQLPENRFSALRQVLLSPLPPLIPPSPKAKYFMRTAALLLPFCLAVGLYWGLSSVPMVERSRYRLDHLIDSAPSHAIQRMPTTQALPTELLKKFVKDWSEAWQRRDLKSYFSFYLPAYRPNVDMTAAQWRSMRAEQLVAPEWVRIELGPIDIKRVAKGYRVEFWQLYRSPDYQFNTRKVLLIVPVGTGFFIKEEMELNP